MKWYKAKIIHQWIEESPSDNKCVNHNGRCHWDDNVSFYFSTYEPEAFAFVRRYLMSNDI